MKGGRAAAIRSGVTKNLQSKRSEYEDILTKYGLEMIHSKKNVMMQNSVEPSVEQPCLREEESPGLPMDIADEELSKVFENTGQSRKGFLKNLPNEIEESIDPEQFTQINKPKKNVGYYDARRLHLKLR